jgi:hypothetical protein
LVIQSFGTNIKYAVDYLKIPTDVVAKKLMVEVHFYDPWDFCGEAELAFYWIVRSKMHFKEILREFKDKKSKVNH